MGQDQNFQVYRVAVLGAAGGIGKHTVLRALEQGHFAASAAQYVC
jgi:nucleoside-diphosphate-sugar epimerase